MSKSWQSPLRRILLAAALCALAPPAAHAQFVQQGAKLVGTGALGIAAQGTSVALSADGNTALAGGPVDNANGQPFGDGATWVWTRSAGVWSQQAKLADPALGPYANQGFSAALSADGNTAIVGAPSNLGSADVWTRSGSVWTKQSTLIGTGSTGDIIFQGTSAALSADGNTAIIGGNLDGGGSETTYGIGAAWVFTRSGSVWTQQGPKLVGSGAVGSSDQGAAVAISGDGNTAIVGGDLDNGGPGGPGAAWVWTRSGGVWTQQGPKLTGTPVLGTGGFGVAAALSFDGNTAIIGGLDSQGGIGAAYPFTRSAGVWTQQGFPLYATDSVGLTYQGVGVAVSGDGNTAIIGGPGDAGNVGAAWVYRRDGGVWAQQGTKMMGTGGVGPSNRGWRVAISSDGLTALVGGELDNDETGAVWVFVATAPAIAVPPADIGACAGSLTTFTSEDASWPGSTAQWQLSTNGGANFADISGATGRSYSFTPTLGDDGNQYRVKYTNSLGTTTSAAGELAVGTAPVITTSPVSQTVSEGAMVTFTAAASGTPTPTVAWFRSSDGGATFARVGGVTSTTLTFEAATYLNGSAYVAVFSSGCTSEQTALATLTVTAPASPPAITVQPESIAVCPGQGGSLDVFLQQGSRLVGTGNSGPAGQGSAVAISADGSTALVGGNIDNSNQGSTWVFTRSGGEWSQQGAKLVGTGGGTLQGGAVALSADGNTALVGGSDGSGGAWVFTRSAGAWTQQGAPLSSTGGAPNEQYGYAVSLSADGNTAAVSENYDSNLVGAVWIFTRSGGVWTQQGSRLVGTGAAGDAAQGTSVALSGDGNTLAVGGSNDNGGVGAVWVWTRSSGVWTQQGPKLVGTETPGNTTQGVRVALSTDGNTLAVGELNGATPGGIFIWTRTAGAWTQQGPRLVGTGAVGNAHQGTSVGLSGDGNTAISGGFVDSAFVGAVWVFTRHGGVWTQQDSKLVGSGSFFPSIFPPKQGTSAALSADGHTVISGGIGDFSTGAAWVFATGQESFTAAADGSPTPTVQWQVSLDGGANFTDLAGATSNGLSVTADPSLNGRQYRAVFSSTSGTEFSDAATFTVHSAPVVTVNPTDLTLADGQTAIFTAAASGNPAATVQWQVSAQGIAGYQNITGATSTVLSFPVTPGTVGNRFRAVFTNTCGTATTGSAVLGSFTTWVPAALAVDTAGNGVLEPGELVFLQPTWTNETGAAASLTGQTVNFYGPSGATYSNPATSGNYGSIANGASASCATCYSIQTNASVRPVQHWDTTINETITPSESSVNWVVHVGESFPDVPTSQQFYKFIENLFHNGITGGCGGGAYCPTGSTTRAQMAVFLLKGKHGKSFIPPACSGVFPDVACPSQFADWIEELFHEGITGGCGGGNYCPNNPVRRDQMAAFLLKSEHGSSYVPPVCTGLFPDVACPSQFGDWIEQLFHESITGGCGGGDYCPLNPNTRGQMAVFLVKTFGLELYGP